MNASGLGEEMVTSNATYVICRGNRVEEEIMNVCEPDLPILLSDESDEDDVIIEVNFSNGNATFTETSAYEEDELKTPMAEFYSAPSAPTITNDNASQRSLSEMSVDTGYHGESDASLLSAGSSFRSEETEKSAAKQQPIASIKEEAEAQPVVVSPPANATPSSPSKPKKERAPLVPPAPAEPRVRTPKAPSKHQLMMEKLKASIAADKAKPKKEIKSKLASSLAPPPQPQQAATANGGEMAPTPEAANTPKRVVNKPAPSKLAMPPPPPRIPKPRQPLYVAPPPKERPPKKTKEPTSRASTKEPISRAASQASIQSTSTARSKTAAPATGKAKPPFPTSSFAATSSKTSLRKPTPSGSTVPSRKPSKAELEAAETKAKAEAAITLEKLKLERLRVAIAYGDSMVLLYKREEESKRREAEEKVRLGLLIEKLRTEMTEAGEDATLRLERLSKSYEEQIREVQRNHEAEEERWEEETNKIHRQHQLKCAELDGKLADAIEQVEKLKKDKHRLEATLAEDENIRIKNLTAEIQSLNTALEMKSDEIKDMRQRNAALLLRVEEIPCKDQEIQKLKHKVKECTHEISRLRETEKTLANEYEDLQRSTRRYVAKTEEIAKENDVLRFHMEESTTSPFSQSFHSEPNSTPVRFRGVRPSAAFSASATLPSRITRSTYGDLGGDYEECLSRSVISMYQSRGRPQSCNADTIYAPEGTFTTVNGTSVTEE